MTVKFWGFRIYNYSNRFVGALLEKKSSFWKINKNRPKNRLFRPKIGSFWYFGAHQRFEQKILRDLKKNSGSATLENKKLDFSAKFEFSKKSIFGWKSNFLFSNVTEGLIFFKSRKIFWSKRWCAPKYQKDPIFGLKSRFLAENLTFYFPMLRRHWFF